MKNLSLIASITLAEKVGVALSVLRWIRHLGGPGLILLGLLDNSVIPVPGSMDALTVVLSAGQRGWWAYYALMATTGSMLGGYVTYRLARQEGKGRFGNTLKPSQMKRVQEIFERWGFGAIAVSALLPPPFPMVPFLIAAGATQYPRNQFLAALFVGRSVRYCALGALSAYFGRSVLALLAQHTDVVLWTAVALAAATIAITIFRTKRRSERHA